MSHSPSRFTAHLSAASAAALAALTLAAAEPSSAEASSPIACSPITITFDVVSGAQRDRVDNIYTTGAGQCSSAKRLIRSWGARGGGSGYRLSGYRIKLEYLSDDGEDGTYTARKGHRRYTWTIYHR